MEKRDYVVLLHGIFLSSRLMRPLAAYLRGVGYDVLNLDYPSTRQPLDELAEMTWESLSARLTDRKPVHFVGYSMGGLLVRVMLNRHRPPDLGRVVMLATPNQGSEVADFLKNFWLYRRLYGPAGQQLVTDQVHIRHLFGEVDYPCGVIAGNASFDPISSFLIAGPDDGKVSVERTKLEGMADHIVVRATHTGFPRHHEVMRQTAAFLQHGHFQR